MEAYLLALTGDWQWWQVLTQFLAPVLARMAADAAAATKIRFMMTPWIRSGLSLTNPGRDANQNGCIG